MKIKEHDCVLLKDGRAGAIVGVYPNDIYLVDIDYPYEQLSEIEDPTEFISAADIQKITYIS